MLKNQLILCLQLNMENTNASISDLFGSFCNDKIERLEKIPQSGGDRTYYRIHTNLNTSYIATVSINVKENDAFIAFSKHFVDAGANVPKVLAVNDNREIYIQEDAGTLSLLDVLEAEGPSDKVFELYQKSLHALAFLQIKGDNNFDYSQCITSKEFGHQAIMSDLLYFKYYFLDTLKMPYDKEQLLMDFDKLAHILSDGEHKFFMFRDFQSRNIMVKENQVCFIDYQGGMKGAMQYDAASLLWQAKSNLSDDWKKKLFGYYMECVEKNLGQPIDKNHFEKQYYGYVLIRLLQVLGAYGFRGLFERKAHFLSSIPLALRNLSNFMENKSTAIVPAFFTSLLMKITDKKVIQKFETIKATTETPLVVKINSFSYLQNGYPKDESKNGGGFVFDCRGILNPGRIDEYKKQSGQDKPVKDYLEQQTLMPTFLNSVYDIVDIAVENYLERGFESLEVNFGCTGGQHRSVFAAESLHRHLKNKFGVKTVLQHLNKSNWLV
jgi:aminoglycoside/choline kinase family phosphotransferase